MKKKIEEDLISVIIPVYNHENYIRETIDSVIKQTDCPKLEIIICNDASTDNSAAIIEQYAQKHKNIIFINNTENKGLQYNLKKMFERSKGQYLAILEGDDFWNDELKLKKQYDTLKSNPETMACFTDVHMLNQETGNLSRHEPQWKQAYGDTIDIHQMIRHGNPTVTFSCCMYNRKILSLVPDSFYEKKNNFVFLFNLYAADYSNIYFIKDCCTTYRVHNNAQWSGLSWREKCMRLIENSCYYNTLFDKKYEEDFLNFIYVLSKSIVVPKKSKQNVKPKLTLRNKLLSFNKYHNKKVLYILGLKFSFKK